MLSFIRDRCGQSLVTYILVLPVLVLVILGAFALWQMISVKMSLHLGTLQAVEVLSRDGAEQWARYLAEEGGNCDSVRRRWAREWAHDGADRMIRTELGRNATMRNTYISLTVDVVPPVNIDVPCHCPPNPPTDVEDVLFRVNAQLNLSPIVVPYIGPVPILLNDSGTGFVECPHNRTLPSENHSY